MTITGCHLTVFEPGGHLKACGHHLWWPRGKLLAKEVPPVDDVEAPSVESGLAAILAADVACYSRLMLGGEEAMTTKLSTRGSLVDELIGRHRGRIVNTAVDSVLAAEFASSFGVSSLWARIFGSYLHGSVIR
jgi:hypothetical protein